MNQIALIPKDSDMIELIAGNVKAATKDMKSSDTWQVPYDQLYILPGFNVREDTEAYRQHIREIADSIKANGFDRTKVLAGYAAKIDGVDRIVVTDGHTRYAAVGIARAEGIEIETLPVVTAARGANMETLNVSMAQSARQRHLSPYEIGTICVRLTSFGQDAAKIAHHIGVTEGYVNDLLLLHGAQKAIREMVRTDRIAAGFAIKELKRDPEKALERLKEAIAVALGQGKAKATAKDAAPVFKTEIKKRAKDLHESLMWVKEDAGWMKLSKGTREFIDEVLSKLPAEPAAK